LSNRPQFHELFRKTSLNADKNMSRTTTIFIFRIFPYIHYPGVVGAKYGTVRIVFHAGWSEWSVRADAVCAANALHVPSGTAIGAYRVVKSAENASMEDVSLLVADRVPSGMVIGVFRAGSLAWSAVTADVLNKTADHAPSGDGIDACPAQK
jgi:hypothetical protein